MSTSGIPLYLLMIELADGNIQLAKTGRQDSDKIIVAREEHVDVLAEIGERLIAENMIIGYQILQTVGAPVRNYEIVIPA